MARIRAVLSAAVLGLALAFPAFAAGTFEKKAPSLSAQMQAQSTYIIKMDTRVARADIPNAAQGLANRFNGLITHTYTNVYGGFAIRMNDGAFGRMMQAPNTFIASATPDAIVTVAARGGNNRPPKDETACVESLGWNIERVTGMTFDSANCAVINPGNYSSSTTKVCVLDSGVSLHDDLNVVGQFNAMAASDLYDPGVGDNYGHGTHVAGIIGAFANNSKGVVGVAPGTPITSIKVLGEKGGYESDILAGLNMAVGQEHCDIVNLSLGGPGGAERSAMDVAISEAAFAGIKFTIAAGNGLLTCTIAFCFIEYVDIEKVTPARASSSGADGIFTIASFGQATVTEGKGKNRTPSIVDAWSSFSNWGPDDRQINNSMVDFILPGENILSTVPGNAYATYDGTSMAAPHMAGLLVRYLARSATDTNNTGFTPGGSVERVAGESYVIPVDPVSSQ